MIREVLCMHDYIHYKSIPSKIDFGKTYIIEDGFTCPHCKKYHEKMLEHGKTVKCECGLEMVLYGNSLYCKLTKAGM